MSDDDDLPCFTPVDRRVPALKQLRKLSMAARWELVTSLLHPPAPFDPMLTAEQAIELLDLPCAGDSGPASKDDYAEGYAAGVESVMLERANERVSSEGQPTIDGGCNCEIYRKEIQRLADLLAAVPESAWKRSGDPQPTSQQSQKVMNLVNETHFKRLWDDSCQGVAELCALAGMPEGGMPGLWTLKECIEDLNREIEKLRRERGPK